jgi:hypothetical protein
MRKYYSPGMISLIFIPIYTLFFFNSYVKEYDFRYLKLNLPSLDTPKNQDDMHFTINSIYRNKDIIEVGEVAKDTNSINNIFEKLANAKIDTTKFKNKNYDYGYKFKLRKNMNYGEIVFLLNKCVKDEYKKYGLDVQNDNFVIFQKRYDFSDKSKGFSGDNILISKCILENLNPEFEISQRYINYKYDKIKVYLIEKRNELFSSSNFNYIYLAYFCFVISILLIKRKQI